MDSTDKRKELTAEEIDHPRATQCEEEQKPSYERPKVVRIRRVVAAGGHKG